MTSGCPTSNRCSPARLCDHITVIIPGYVRLSTPVAARCAAGFPFMTTMIRVAELRDAVDRARGAINDPRVFNPIAMSAMFDFEMACADASYSDVVGDPDVAAACV